ncbi:hypothetical protein MHYP_G00242020 [Metynnis hypsauchen]
MHGKLPSVVSSLFRKVTSSSASIKKRQGTSFSMAGIIYCAGRALAQMPIRTKQFSYMDDMKSSSIVILNLLYCGFDSQVPTPDH